jgi:hypothetical protein
MGTRHAGRELVRQHGYARIIALSEFGDFALPGWLGPEAEWSAFDTGPERQKKVKFWHRFEAFWAKSGPKTAKKGPKSATSSYSSVNYVFLYIAHYLILT